jgi:hypothetical protein
MFSHYLFIFRVFTYLGRGRKQRFNEKNQSIR